MLKECNYEIKNDGIFWICLKDFVKSFRGVEISRVHPKY